jgi:hypothetical protein
MKKKKLILTLQRNLWSIKLDINNKVCYTTIQPLKKEADHATSHSMRRTPLLSTEI